MGRILVIRGGALGDFVLTLPVLAALRAQFPRARLEVLGYPHIARLALLGCLADAAHPIEARALAGFFARGGALDPSMAEFFDGFAVILSFLYDPDGIFRANVARCSRAQFIAGQHRPDERAGLHAVETFLGSLQSLAVFDAELRPRLTTDPQALGPGHWLAAHPGSGSELKNWPEWRWAELLGRVVKESDWNVLLVGGEAEGDRLGRLAAAIPAERLRVARSLPLDQLSGWLRGCNLFVGHDSGITHLAAAVGLPCLVLWGPSNPTVWRPRGDRILLVQDEAGLPGLQAGAVWEILRQQMAVPPDPTPAPGLRMNRPTRRLLFVDHVSRILGGAEVNLVELLAEPASRQQWQSLAACDPNGRLHGALEPLGVERHSFQFDPTLGTLRVVGRGFPLLGAARSLRALRQARRDLVALIAQLRPDAVISCTNKDHFAAWPACRQARIPSVWWVNDILSADFFPWAARRAFCHQARRGASRLVVVSDFARAVLLQQALPPEKVVTIHNGIPLERYRPRPRGTLRGMLSIPESEPLAGVVGRFTPWKGQELFLRLAEAWCQRSTEGQFALIGHAFNEDQAFEQGLREFVRTRNLRSRIHLVPFQRDVAAALSDLDVLVHTSLKPEPFGRVIIEAMAVGVPVLAARGGGVPEIITHGQDGLLAAPNHLEDYLTQLTALLGDTALRQRLQAAAARTVSERFSVSRVQEQFDRLLQDLP